MNWIDLPLYIHAFIRVGLSNYPYNLPMHIIDTSIMPTANGIVHVTRDEQLPAALELLAKSDYLAVDTEFLRESTYFAKLCLIQLGNEHACVVIDVLALSHLNTVLEFILDRQRIKIFHAARQDLEVLTQAQSTNPQVPGPLFDTQIAAGLLGLPAQIGYSDLLARTLNINIAKGQARTDWSKRPLSTEQLHYAADDVRYLAPLYQYLKQHLINQSRYQWLNEETAELENLSLYQTHPDAAWQRLKGTAQLQPKQRAVLKQLANWREARAIEFNKPRGWILSDEALRNITERLPETLHELGHTRDLPEGVLRKHGEALLTLILNGISLAESEPEAVDFRPTNSQQSEVSQLMKVVRSTAETINVSPELLATRRDIERLVYFDNADALMKGWRKEVIGEALLATRRS